jgi:hypothetical protein
MNAADLTAVAAAMGALASLGTFVFAIVIWVQGLRAKTRAVATHDLVNSLATRDRKAAGIEGYAAGRADRTDHRLDALEADAPPPAP